LCRGETVRGYPRARLRRPRRDMQIVFQDPYSSLNPRMRVGTIVEEPLVIHRIGSRAERRTRVEELFRLVEEDVISEDVALSNASNQNDFRLKLQSIGKTVNG